jgi:uncharacterized protein (DUF433 family)
MTAEQSSITLDPNVLAGKPVIRGTRLSVEFVIGLMADGWSEADILTNYPGIRHEDILALVHEYLLRLSSFRRSDYLTRIETGMPRLVMRFSTLQPIFASTR